MVMAMVACGEASGGKVQIGAAPRSEAAEKLFQCASSQAPKTPQTVVGTATISVCRVNEAGQIAASQLTPRFFVASKNGVMRVAQLFGTDLTYEGTAPEAQMKLEIENEVNLFLKKTCAPQIERVFKRSSLDLNLAFRSYRETDRLSLGTVSKVTTAAVTTSVTTNDDLLGTGTNQTDSSEREKAKPKTRDAADLTGILKLVFGKDEGISIRDEVGAVSSGPLKSTKTEDEEKNLAFCAQLLMRVSENMGVGEGRDCESRNKASLQDKAASSDKAIEKASAPKVADAKSSSGKTSMIIGLTKADGFKPSDVKNLKLADDEVFGIVKPICGELKTAAKIEKTESK